MHIFMEGSYSLITSLRPGEILGADLIFTRSQLSPYHAVTAADTQIVYFPAGLATQPGLLPDTWRAELNRRLAAWISNVNIKKEYRLAILSQKGLQERILMYLTLQTSRRQTTAFAIPFSREELAAYLCVNRSALSHELSRMQEEGEGNQTFFAGRQHFPDACREEAHGVFGVPLGVEHPLGRPRGAGGGPGDHPSDLGLGGQKIRAGFFSQHSRGGKGQLRQLRQTVQPFGICGVDSAPLFQPGQRLIEPSQL